MMKVRFTRLSRLAALAAVAIAAMVAAVAPLAAQNPQVQEKLAALKQSIAANKQAMAQYSWQELETISVKGEVKDTKTYQVQMGPNGQPQKTEVGNEPAQQGHEGRLKKRVVTHVTDEYQQYGQQIAALAKQYNPPSAPKLEAAYKQGNVSLDLGGGAGTVSLVIKNYVKPNDSLTVVSVSYTHLRAHETDSY